MIAGASKGVVQIGTVDGTGSGFVLDTPIGKAVITNAHVVGKEATTSLWVDDTSLGTAQVLGVDEYLDLAVIRLRNDQVSRGQLTALRLGDSEKVATGQDVFVLGYPKGYSGPPTLTRGVVSRTYTTTMSNGEDATVIQTDAAVNFGNSGGPLLDRSGVVIGVIFAIEVAGTTGIAYATSSNDLKRVLGPLSQGGKRLQPTLTPTPGPTVSPTGHWLEVEKLKIVGTSLNTWVLTLHGWGPYSPEELYTLRVRCDDLQGGGRELQLYLTVVYEEGKTFDLEEKRVIVLYGGGTTAADADARATYPSNPRDPRIDWWFQPGASKSHHNVWASDEARDEILEAMLNSVLILVIKVVSGDGTATYIFDTTGFDQASKEIRDRCK